MTEGVGDVKVKWKFLASYCSVVLFVFKLKMKTILTKQFYTNSTQ